MTEQLANFAATLLNGAIDADDTAVTVDSVAGWPATGDFRLVVQDAEDDSTNREIVKVTAVAGLVLTVMRGQEGTAGVAHADNSWVGHVLTAEALEQLVADQMLGLGAQMPALGQAFAFAPGADLTIASDTLALMHSSLDITFVAPASGRALVLGSVVCQASALMDAQFLMYLDADTGTNMWLGSHQFDASAPPETIPLGALLGGLNPGQTYVAHLRWARVGSGTLTNKGFSRGGAQRGTWWVVLPLPKYDGGAGGEDYSAVSLTKSADQAVTQSVSTAVTFDGEELDTDGYHDNTTNPSRITAPVAGLYLVGGSVEMLGLADGTYVLARIRKNGTTVIDGRSRTGMSIGAGASVHFSKVVPLAAGDFVELWMEHNDAAADVRASVNGTSFWAVRLPPAHADGPVGVFVAATAAQSIPNSTSTNVAFGAGTEKFDTHGFHSETTQNTRLTVPPGQAGKYAIHGGGAWGIDADGKRRIILTKNGAAFSPNVADARMAVTDGTATHQSVYTVEELAVGDYVEMQVDHIAGAALDFTGRLSIVRFGDATAPGPLTQAKAVHATPNAVTSLPASTWTPVALASELFDDLSAHSLVTDNTRITIPAGTPTKRYLVGGQVTIAANVTGTRLAKILKNNGPLVGIGGGFAAVSSPTCRVVVSPSVVELAAGDYVELLAWQNSGGALDTVVEGGLWLVEVNQQAGTGVANKLDATAAPTANDDLGDGFGPGSIWVDITHDVAYMCVDAGAAAAVWRLLGAAQVGCRAYNDAAQTVTAATETTILFNSEEWDTDAIHSVAAATGDFVIPAGMAGRWRFSLHFSLIGNHGASYAYLRKNGVAIIGSEIDDTDTTDWSAVVSVEVDVVAGDVVTARGFRTTGTTFGSASSATMCSMEADYVAGVIGDSSQRKRKTAGSTRSANTFADVTDLTFPVAANTAYVYRFVVFFFTEVATNGLRLSVNGPSDSVEQRFGAIIPTAPQSNAVGMANGQQFTLGTSIIGTTSGPGLSGVMAIVEGSIVTGPTAGTLALQFASEDNVNDVSIEQGSWGELSKVS